MIRKSVFLTKKERGICMCTKQFIVSSLFIIVLQSFVSGAVVYQDDFSAPQTSYLAWISSNNDFNKATFVDGGCKVVNSSPTYTAFVSHQITLPATFSYSCMVTRSDATVSTGIAFYQSNTGNYSIILGEREIFVMAPGTTSVPGVSCPNLDAKANKITISKKESTYNVFINDRFTTTFTDAKSYTGGIAFLNYPGTTATFDNVIVTDQFIEGSSPKCYADSFDDTSLKYWNIISNKCTKKVENGKFTMTTEDNDSAYCFLSTDLKLTNFVVRVEVSHVTGSAQSIYGLRLYGSANTDVATFVINGDRNYGSAVGANQISMALNSKIKGKAMILEGQTITFIDTLEIVKKANSTNYFFVVNKDTMDTLTGINFPITSVGFFGQKNLALQFDNFAAAEGDSAYCPTKIRQITRASRAISLQNQGTYKIFDILGRNAYTMNFKNTIAHSMDLSSGMYVNKVTKTMILQKK
jgi:hypothetical protein